MKKKESFKQWYLAVGGKEGGRAAEAERGVAVGVGQALARRYKTLFSASLTLRTD